MLVVEGGGVHRGHRGVHAAQPGVALDEPDPVRGVSHPQPRMTALIGVGPGAAPVLLEEHPQPVLGGRQIIVGIQRAQHLIVGDQLVEARHDGAKRRRATYRVVKGLRGLGHGTILVHRLARA